MTATLTPYPADVIVARLVGVKETGARRWTALCPAHDDRTPSLSITEGREHCALLHCHAGCDNEAIMQAIGLETSDLYVERRATATNGLHMVRSDVNPAARPRRVASWRYTDETGALLFTTERLEFPLEPGQTKPRKKFRQSRPDPTDANKTIWNLDGVRLVLYRLPELRGAVEDGKRVFVVEGEKHADALWALGYPATTNPMGALKWHEEFGAYLAGADVVILPDNDDVGREHAEQVAASLTARGCAVRVVALPGVPEKGDIVDWLALPHPEGAAAALEALVNPAPAWTREALDARVGARQTRFTLRELLANDEVMRPPMAVVPRVAWGGRLTLLAGLYKLGKSTLTGYLSACVTKGTPFLDIEPCRQGDVLLVGLEEWIGDPARRLRQFGADPDRMHVVDKLLAGPTERLAELEGHIEAVRPALVVIDSLIKFGAGIIDNENDSAQMMAVVDPLTELAHRYGEMGLILIAHARRSDGRARGSGAIMGAADIVAEFTQPEGFAQSRPMLRRMLTAGRVPVLASYDFVYDGRRYAIDGAEQALGDAPVASLESRILSFVRDHPACSARAVREGVEGREVDIANAISRLLASHALVDSGTSKSKHKLSVPGDLTVDIFTDDLDGQAIA